MDSHTVPTPPLDEADAPRVVVDGNLVTLTLPREAMLDVVVANLERAAEFNHELDAASALYGLVYDAIEEAAR